MMLGQHVFAPVRDALEHAEFRKLWFGNLVSGIGSSVTRLALPLAAALTLGAGPMDLGLLTAAGGPYCAAFTASTWGFTVVMAVRAFCVPSHTGFSALMMSERCCGQRNVSGQSRAYCS